MLLTNERLALGLTGKAEEEREGAGGGCLARLGNDDDGRGRGRGAEDGGQGGERGAGEWQSLHFETFRDNGLEQDLRDLGLVVVGHSDYKNSQPFRSEVLSEVGSHRHSSL